MTPQDVTMAALAEIVHELTDGRIAADQVRPQARLLEDLGLDSLTLMALVFMCESRFMLDLSSHTASLPRLVTAGQALEFLHSLRRTATC